MSVETAAEGAEIGREAGGADVAAAVGAAGGGAEAAGAAAAAASADFPLVSGASEAPPEAAGVAV